MADRAWRGFTRPLRLLATIFLLDSLGTGMFLAGSAVFYVVVVGLDTALVGALLSVASLIGLVTTVPLGRLADKLGARRAIIALQALRAVALVALAFARSPQAFMVAAVMLSVVEGPVPAVNQALVAEHVSSERRSSIMAVFRTLRNVGFSLGAAAAVPMLASGDSNVFMVIVLANAASYVVVSLMLLGLPKGEPRVDVEPRGRFHMVKNGRFVQLTAANGILALHMTLLSISFPLWAVSYTSTPTGVVPVFVIINTILVVAFQVRFTKNVHERGQVTRKYRAAGVALALCCLLLAATNVAVPGVPGGNAYLDVALMVMAVVALTAGELWQSASAWEASFGYAPEDRRSTYLAFFSLGPALQQVVGPVLLTAGLFPLGAWGWVALGALLLVSGIWAGASAPTDAAQVASTS